MYETPIMLFFNILLLVFSWKNRDVFGGFCAGMVFVILLVNVMTRDMQGNSLKVFQKYDCKIRSNTN